MTRRQFIARHLPAHRPPGGCAFFREPRKRLRHHTIKVHFLKHCFNSLTAFVTFGACFAQGAWAAQVWTGPLTTFTQAPGADPTLPASQDRLTGNVWITRATTMGLYNAETETSYTHLSSPAGTEWALGALADYAALTYSSWEGLFGGTGGGGPTAIVGNQTVVHLLADDIYLSMVLTSWPQHGGGFSYQRSTAAVPVPPTVSITSPSAGATFAAPASIGLTATATGGSVTNVEFFAGTASLGHATASPFSVTGSIAAPGAYALTAVATAAGVSGTSSVVNISVVAPLAVSLTAPSAGRGLFSFSYSANPGLSYVVQSSSNLVDWVPVATNTASSTLVPFSEGLTAKPSRYYRVGRLPNP